MKKNIYNLFLILALGLIAFACEDDPLEDNIGVGERVEQATLASPANNVTVSLNAGTPDATIVIAWEAAAAGKSGTPLYRFLLDVKGGDFSSPLASIDADNAGAANQATLTQGAINAAIANANTTEFIWTVESRIEGGAQTDRKLANAFAINIEPFGTEGISAFSYTTPSINEQLLLDKIRTPNDSVVFDWDAATSVSGTTVTYKLQFDNPGGDFSSPLLVFDSDNSGLDDQLSFTQSSFADALDGINIDNGLDWRVVATAGDFTFIPETRFVWFDSFNIETLYVLGDATSAGWNNDGVSPIQLDMKSPGVFETTIPLEGDKEIKFVLVSGSWDVNWGGPDLAGSPVTSGQEYDLVSSGPNIKIPNTGTFVINVDFISNKFTLTEFKAPDALYLVGDATEAGWNNDNTQAIFRDPNNQQQFYYRGFFKAGAFKLLETPGQWQPQWGKGSAEGVIGINDGSGSDPDVISVPADGYYELVIDAGASSYTFNAVDITGATAYNTLAIIGSATPNGWGDPDTDMTVSTIDPHIWTIETTLSAEEMKFRANDGWDVNWGDAIETYGVGSFGGPNIPVSEAGTYLIRFSDLDGRYAIIKK